MVNEYIHNKGKTLVMRRKSVRVYHSNERTLVLFISFVFVVVIALSSFFLLATRDG